MPVAGKRMQRNSRPPPPSARKPVVSPKVPSREAAEENKPWTSRLVLFLRLVAMLAMIKGLYHWAQLIGFTGAASGGFENQSTAWQASTIYFAVIELVAAVGLWLATPWGAVVWLTSAMSMAVIELMFPTIFGGNFIVVVFEGIMIIGYLALVWMAARERSA